MPDNPTPLAQVDDFNQTAFADLAQNLQANELASVMLQSTRLCEAACGPRRLAPFTGKLETSRMDAGDIEEAAGGGMPLPAQAQMGLDYAAAIGAGQMARHAWVNEYPPLYPEYWTGAISSVSIYWPYQSAPYALGPQQCQYDIDTGHVRFLLGTFVPFGSTAYITYSGGYSTVPADLVAACVTMAASVIVKRLEPASSNTGHDPDFLRDEAIEMLEPYIRD